MIQWQKQGRLVIRRRVCMARSILGILSLSLLWGISSAYAVTIDTFGQGTQSAVVTANGATSNSVLSGLPTSEVIGGGHASYR